MKLLPLDGRFYTVCSKTLSISCLQQVNGFILNITNLLIRRGNYKLLYFSNEVINLGRLSCGDSLRTYSSCKNSLNSKMNYYRNFKFKLNATVGFLGSFPRVFFAFDFSLLPSNHGNLLWWTSLMWKLPTLAINNLGERFKWYLNFQKNLIILVNSNDKLSCKCSFKVNQLKLIEYLST